MVGYDGTSIEKALVLLHAALGGSWSVAGELRALAALPGGRAAEIGRRLAVLIPVAAGTGPDVTVGAAATDLGLSRRSTQLLLARLRTMRPVEALTPRSGAGRTTRRRGSGPSDVRLALVDAEVRDLVGSDRAASLADAVARVLRALVDAGHDPVSSTTVSRRLDAARSSCDAAGNGLAADVLLATSPIAAAGLVDGRLEPLCAALLVDAGSGAILAWGAAPAWRGVEAVASMTASYRGRVDALRSIGSARRLRRFEMVPPPGLPEAALAAVGATPGPLVRAGLRRLLGGSPAASLLRPRASRRRRDLDDDEIASWLVLDRRTLPLVLGGIFAIPAIAVDVAVAGRPDALDELARRLDALREALPAEDGAGLGSFV